MNRVAKFVACLSLVALPAAPALAGWKLVEQGKPSVVAKGMLKVTPGENWSRWSVRPIKKSEVWTIDGTTLNELYFVSGLVAGETLYRDSKRKDQPLPKLGPNAQLTDIPDFFESSNRIALATSMFRVSSVEPMKFGGVDGIKFTFEYAVEGSTLIRKGVAAGALVKDQLYLISFAAPATYYFDRDRAKAEAIIASSAL